MLRYLLRDQPGKSGCLFVLTAVGSALEVGLAYIMALCVNLAMENQLSKALPLGIGFLFYIAAYLCLDYGVRRLKFRVLQSAQTSLRDHLLGRILSMDSGPFIKRIPAPGFHN